uniref:Doublesex and mab-3 related transcription factor 3, truncated n=1 Tax=Elaeis guineensis var. tenera TaxID=51953 RepID=A0A6I9SK59_ELAGV|nr:doublesex and mab-3 related transcription factor 3, truncated [Elaeis guineensis]
MSGSTKREGKSKESSLAAPEAEVEALLRAAQDDLLLKLRVDSHPISSRPSSSFDALDSDLARRFEALKSPPPPLSTAAPPPQPSKPVGKGATAPADGEWGRILGDDLAARFATLKGSSSGPNPGIQQPDLMTPDVADFDDKAGAGAGAGGGDGVSEKEVEKVMQWAMDAARLDPSKGDRGEDDDDDGESTDDDEGEEEEEEEEDVNQKKMKEMNEGKPKKKFFFF